MGFPTVVANVKGPFTSRAGQLHSLEEGTVAELLESRKGKEMNLDRTSDMRNRNKTRVELVRNLVAHGDAREGKWRGNWQMQWVASTLTPPPNVVYPESLKLMRTPRLPTVDWTDTPTDLNGLVRFGEKRNLVSARVPSRSVRAIHQFSVSFANLMDVIAMLFGINMVLICKAVTIKREMMEVP